MKIAIKDIEVCAKCTSKRCSFINLASIEQAFFNLSSETTICPTSAIGGSGPSEKSIEKRFIIAEKGTCCVECGLCVKHCSHQNLDVEDYNANTSAFGNLTNLQIKAVTSLYLNGLFGFAANTNRNNSLSFDGYVASEKGEEAFVEIDYKDDSLECVRRILGDIIKYSDTHKIKNGIVVLSRLPQIGSRDVYNLLEKMKKFPTTNDISIYMTTFSHLRSIYLYMKPNTSYLFENLLYNPIKEDLCTYQKKVENLFTDIMPPLFDEI